MPIKLYPALVVCAWLGILSGCQTTPGPTPPTDSAVAQPATAPEPVAEPSQDPLDALADLARQAVDNENFAEAVVRYRQLIAVRADYPLAQTNLGLALLQQDAADEAKTHFLIAIDQDKDDFIAYNHLAIIARQAGQFDTALEYYQRALSANPDYANAHLNLGILLDIYLQKLPDALKHYQEYQRLTGNQREDVGKWIVDIERRIGQQK